MDKKDTFRQRVRNRDRVIGTFVKTANTDVVEILGASGLDFLALDAEHAIFDRRDIDAAALAARSASIPLLVRLADRSQSNVQTALDAGCSGLIVPHLMDADDANLAVKNARYMGGSRGFSNSPRTGRFGAVGMEELLISAADMTCVVGQIEDAGAIEHAGTICAVQGLDAVLIGRADLAVSLGVTRLDHPAVVSAVERICRAAQDAGSAIGIFLPNTQDVSTYEALGVTLFVIGSDQSMLRQQAGALAAELIRR